ncbi:hypothetical protein BXZ70DRAFT_907585 [Cristinia sonorae]|uniref:Uncharacterized protein n=1 Tax=Cristinia sonorae TaxID=1940300 RepID=A0A8K0XPD5_9AGAR|nr:hypothetical protein BXZ70DRAFT_907585 [Cristinia sonorae]
MSFSSPLPAKAARTPLRRTGSFLSLADMDAANKPQRPSSSSAPYSSSASTQSRALRQYREQRDRRRATRTNASSESFIVIQQHSAQPTPVSKPMYTPPQQQPKAAFPSPRTSSPLSPTRSVLPARASFPRSKREPDLYKVAIITRMRHSPEGQKILHMGPRLALSIHAATKELERMVAAQQGGRDRDGDVTMMNEDGSMSASWVVVPPEDWEMVVDCCA